MDGKYVASNYLVESNSRAIYMKHIATSVSIEKASIFSSRLLRPIQT